MIKAMIVLLQWGSRSTLKRGSGTTGWLGEDAVLWWTPGGKQVTVNTLRGIRWLLKHHFNVRMTAGNAVD